ncbi:hypothetical protein [Moraxella lacunata]|uniref:hypothetical protein n=1 Tax=Moraxella lacunata TaxID=477 RepID=UPI003EE12C0A
MGVTPPFMHPYLKDILTKQYQNPVIILWDFLKNHYLAVLIINQFPLDSPAMLDIINGF